MKSISLFLLIIIFSSCGNKPPLPLNKGEILNEIHQNSIGQIAFMNDWIPFKAFTKENFNKQLVLSESSDFGFRMFLGKTLTHSLSQLEPELTVRELCDKGNFQLTFYVDNKEIYQYNLQTGAGSCEYKNSATVYGIPLKDKEERDHWGRFLWMKFMKLGGGQEALLKGDHLLKIEVRPYIEHSSLKVGDIIAQGEVQLTTVEKEVEESKIAIQPIQLTDKWEIVQDGYDTTKIRQLNEKIAQNYFKNITSIVLAKDGKLLIEEYFNKANRNTLHDMRSVGKTLASTVLGIAIKEGHIKKTEQTLKEFYKLDSYKNNSQKKGMVTLKSLLTMSSGFDGTDINPDSPGNEEKMYPTNDWVKFALDLPMDESKTIGKDWDYFTAGVVVLGDILNQTVPNELEKYADKKLFSPLNITTYKWQFTPTNVPNTAGGFQMNSLDNARYGQLYLDKGKYKDKEILSEKWVQESLSKQVSIPNREEEFYGYLFWNKSFKVQDKKLEAYYASGNGGNKIMILKDIGVVIVITATAYGQPYMHQQADEIVEKYMLPSIL